MKPKQILRCANAIALVLAVVALAPAYAAGNAYESHNLVSDGFVPADNLDKNLVNAWGIAFNPNGAVWVSDNHAGVATLYDGFGKAQLIGKSFTVAIPAAPGNSGIGSPTGIVFSSANDFVVHNADNSVSGPSRFIFSSEDGALSGWAPTVDLNHAIRAQATPNAIYKGLALGANGTSNFLYATDFHNAKIDVFDKKFNPVSVPGGFVDPTIPAGFAPFGIQNIGGALFVTYAKQDAQGVDDVRGEGFGFVNVFDVNGKLIRRVASRGKLNSPWGIALAPADFGKFANRLLIGNFGDGAIRAFDLHSGEYKGQLRKSDGQPLKIENLWGLQFGNGVLNQSTNTLFFSAGPDIENHGLYGSITAVQATKRPDRDDDD